MNTDEIMGMLNFRAVQESVKRYDHIAANVNMYHTDNIVNWGFYSHKYIYIRAYILCCEGIMDIYERRCMYVPFKKDHRRVCSEFNLCSMWKNTE